MRIYVYSLGAGILVGVIYAMLHVRSPAPPFIALVGLLGILIGEQILPIAQSIRSGEKALRFVKTEGAEQLPGLRPGDKGSEGK